jgi:hypothetical protein
MAKIVNWHQQGSFDKLEPFLGAVVRLNRLHHKSETYLARRLILDFCTVNLHNDSFEQSGSSSFSHRLKYGYQH